MQCKHPDVQLLTRLVYNPSQEQIDLGTDRDEKITEPVCQSCGEVVYDN